MHYSTGELKMKIEIDLKACRYCEHFECETEDGYSFLDNPFCKKSSENVSDYESCKDFSIYNEVLKTIRQDFNKDFVRVLK